MGTIKYDTAFRNATNLLGKLDIKDICQRCGAEYAEEQIRITYLGSNCSIDMDSFAFSPDDIPQTERILILHYLTSSAEKPEAGDNSSQDFVSYQSLPGGMFYYPTFRKRGPEWLTYVFSDRPELLPVAAGPLGAIPGSFGDISVIIPVFPKIDIAVVIFKGDEEFPTELNFLFKPHIVNYLTLEDIAVLGGVVAGRLRGNVKTI